MSSNWRKRERDAVVTKPTRRPRGQREKSKLAFESMSADDRGKLPNTILGWFDNTLGTDDPKPSFEACIKLARDFQIILNRHNNAELERIAELEGRPVDPFEHKDVSWTEWEGKKIRKFKDAANHLMAEAEELEKWFGGYVWENSGVTLAEIQQLLGRIGAFPKARTPNRVTRGRAKEAWHSVARDIARAIISALREAGYTDTLSVKNENSVTCVVGAKIINLAFGLRIGEAAFVSAVRNRDRTRRAGAKSFFERYPDAAKIKILD
jgi:hypothetical protein